MSFFSNLFRSKPETPFVEYPDGHLNSAKEALQKGILQYRRKGRGRTATISWQGQGSQTDSYHVVDLGLIGDVVSFEQAPIDLERSCTEEGLEFEKLRCTSKTALNIASLCETQAADLLEALLVKHVGVRPFEDSDDYCVGFEYESQT